MTINELIKEIIDNYNFNSEAEICCKEQGYKELANEARARNNRNLDLLEKLGVEIVFTRKTISFNEYDMTCKHIELAANQNVA